MKLEEALAIVRETIENLPPEVISALRDVDVMVKTHVTPEEIRLGIPASVAGVYVERDRQGEDDDTEERKKLRVIVLYLDNVIPCDADHIRGVFAHEALHALGLDEARVEAAGL